MKSKFLLIVILLIAAMNLFAFEFAVECLSTNLEAIQGFGSITSVHLALISGPPQTVKMTAGNLPAGVSVAFSPSDIPFDREGGHYPYTSIANVKITTSSSTPVGTHTIKLIGTGGGLTREASLTLQVTALSTYAKGKTYYVATSGSDAGQGAAAQPFRTIQKGADVAMPGDIIIVKAGVYQECVQVKTSGTAASPIMFLGEPGAIVDPSRKITGWQTAPEIGAGVYKKSVSEIGFDPRALTYTGKMCVWPGRRDRVDGVGSAMELLTMTDGWWGVTDVWNTVGAIGFSDGTTAYVHLKTNQSPDNEDAMFAPGYIPTFQIYGKNYITIRGFTIRNGTGQISIRSQSTGTIIEHNTIMGGVYCITINSATNTCIRNNEMTLNFYYNDFGHPINITERDYFLYILLRKYGEYDKHWAIYVENSNDTKINENHIYRHFAGILQIAVTNKLRISRNYIHHTGYNIEFKSMGDTLWLNDNLLYEATENWRNDFVPDNATFFVYRNRFGLLSHSACGCTYGNKTSPNSDDIEMNMGTTAKIYFYHNSFTGYVGITSYAGTDGRGPGGPNIWLVNNIFSNFYEAFSMYDQSNYHYDFNWFGGFETSWISSHGGPRNLIYNGKAMWDSINPSYMIPTTTPGAYARQSGIDLSKSWTALSVTHPALPGMSPGYFSGRAPDMGAIQTAASSVQPGNSSLPPASHGQLFYYPASRYSTAIEYVIDQSENVCLDVCNHQGKRIRRFGEAEKAQGKYRILWNQTDDNGDPISNGVYYCRLSADKQVLIKKMMVIR